MKRKFLAVILAFVVTLLLPLHVGASSVFKDVSSSDWASKEIDFLYKRGIVKGTGNGQYMPKKALTRAEAAILLTRALNLDAEDNSPLNYKDVKDSHSAYKEIAAVTKAKIMTGYGNGTFQPDKPLTRAEMAKVLSNSFELAGEGKVHFSDVNKDHWAYSAIDALYSAGIAKGYGDGTYKPENFITRAEFAALLSRTLVNYESDLAALLREVYNNEASIQSFVFTTDFELGINLPSGLAGEVPELALLAEALKDVKVKIDGVYQLNPMKMEMDIQLNLGKPLNTSIDLPIILTEKRFLVKVPEIPQLPIPEELAGKFIAIDMAELQGMNGIAEPIAPSPLTVEEELIKELNELVISNFVDGFFEYADKDEIDIPAGIDVKEVVKLEINDDDLKRFLLIVIEDFYPAFFEIMTNPEYAEALGLTAEDLELLNAVKEDFELMKQDMIAFLDEIVNIISINEFASYFVIDENHYIPYTTIIIDMELLMGEEILGLKLYSVDKKSKINETVTFKYDNISEKDIISLEDLLNTVPNID